MTHATIGTSGAGPCRPTSYDLWFVDAASSRRKQRAEPTTDERLESREVADIDGHFRWTTVIVTAGVGTSAVPMRYAAPGSIELVELRLQGSAYARNP